MGDLGYLGTRIFIGAFEGDSDIGRCDADAGFASALDDTH